MSMSTICAIATARGGAIGIIRVSGPESISIVSAVFTPSGGSPLSERRSHTIVYGTLNDEDGEVVDDVLVSIFRAPHSYTGEDSVEISCHGSDYILQQVVRLLMDHGATHARPGEFTQRAFLNGKMDLSQAEAVADLIASRNAATHRLAMSQMRGGFSRQLRQLRDELLEMSSLLELELDFSEEDVEFADRQKLRSLAVEIASRLQSLTNTFRMGNAIRNGIPVAIIGETNVGKSTLLNSLLRDDKAIVSDIDGTTRDVVEDTMTIRGVCFRLMDTAGIRHTDDVVERMGIDRTFAITDQALIVLWLLDGGRLLEAVSDPARHADVTRHIEEVRQRIIPHCADKQLLVVVNKSDLIPEDRLYDIYHLIYDNSGINENETIRISAKNGDNISALEDMLVDASSMADFTDQDVVVTNLRHYEALHAALDSINDVIRSLDANLSGDLVSEDLRLCLQHLGEIVGEITTDETLAAIFSKFCVGK